MDYFVLEKLNNSYRNPFKYNFLEKFSEDDKYLMMSESRPETMSWIYLEPKNLV